MNPRLPSNRLSEASAPDQLWFKLRSAESRLLAADSTELLDAHALIVASGGEGDLYLDLTRHRLGPESVYLAAPGQTLGLRPGDGRARELYIVRFDVRLESGEPARLPLCGMLSCDEDGALRQRCSLLAACMDSGSAIERYRGEALLHEMLHLVWAKPDVRPEAGARAALERTLAYMDTHYAEPLTIERLAQMAEISPKYYVDLFKKAYGRSAIDYLTEVRLNEAKRLIARSEARLSDIAHRIGYQDEFYFSRKFKQHMGMPPAAYRKSKRLKIAAYMPHITGHLIALNRHPHAAPLHPKWTPSYYAEHRHDISLHLNAYMADRDWRSDIHALAVSVPHLIVATDAVSPAEREALAPIAEVLLLRESDSWREQLRQLSDRLGERDEAEAWLDRYERRRAAAGRQLRKAFSSERILVLSYRRDRFTAWPIRGIAELLGDELGLSLAGAPAEAGRAMTLEDIAAIDADWLWMNIKQESATLVRWRAIEASEAWQNLPAVRRRRVRLLSSDPWREYSACAMERKLEDLLRIPQGYRPDQFWI